jgi:hypothetical protein
LQKRPIISFNFTGCKPQSLPIQDEPERLKQFLEGSEAVEFRGVTAKEKYYWLEDVLIRFKYHVLKRDEKVVIR